MVQSLLNFSSKLLPTSEDYWQVSLRDLIAQTQIHVTSLADNTVTLILNENI